MTHPSSMVRNVGLTVEVDISSFVKITDLAWLANEAIAISGTMTDFVLNLAGETSTFLSRMGTAGKAGVNQQLISQLKHARDVGAMFVFLRTRREE